ncbi:MAG: DUF2752 domain-containing protein [Planctomycetota bacterium]
MGAPAIAATPAPIRSRKPVADILLHPWSAMFALVVAIGAFALPKHGIPGLRICAFEIWTALPCPGCGMTRSMTCLAQGDLLSSVTYHPFGVVFAPLLAFALLAWLLPVARRSALRGLLFRREQWLRPAYNSLIISFVVFGVARIAIHLAQRSLG